MRFQICLYPIERLIAYDMLDPAGILAGGFRTDAQNRFQETRNGSVRSIDIANELDYTKPSVSRAMSILRRDGLIVMEGTGHIAIFCSGQGRAGVRLNTRT